MAIENYNKFNKLFLPYLFLAGCLVSSTLLIRLVLNYLRTSNHVIYSICYFIFFGLFYFFIKEKYISLSTFLKYSLLMSTILLSVVLSLI